MPNKMANEQIDVSETGQKKESMRQYLQRKKYLIFYSFAFFLASSMNTIFFKKMTNSMVNYTWTVSQVSTAVYLPIFLCIVLAEGSPLCNIPWKYIMGMGALDSLAGVLTVIGGVYTAGSSQVLLNQAGIPITLVLSVILLSKQYHSYHYTTAFFS